MPCLSMVLCFASARAQESAARDFLWFNPARIVTAERCRECHALEYDVWKETKHATGFRTTHRKKSAEEIASSMGFRLMKRESLCLKCHYLGVEEDGQLRAASGVSCESCHGTAKDWINIHNDYGKGASFRTETPEHKARRIALSKANGMFRPSELYDVVANCFQCHTVPHERLVNTGGHTTGSEDFEFVERSGQIQHNFLQAQFDARSSENRDRPPERRRIMYVVGRTVDLEYSLRGVALAREDGEYLRGMQRRVRGAINRVKAISRRTSISEVEEILRIAGEVEISSAKRSYLLDSAERIGRVIRQFIASNDGSQLAAIDELLGSRRAVLATFTKDELARMASLMDLEKTFRTIGSGCSCHKVQNRWLPRDAHSSSLRPFTNKSRRNIEIAERYGIDPSELTKGTSRCMDCHATVLSGDEAEEAFESVGCESCHGPASEYKNIHQKNGYAAGKNFGMVQLLDLNERAETCVRCHYITEEKLLAAGHTSGADFDFVAGNIDIRHWQGQSPAVALAQAYDQAKRKRAQVPTVALASAPGAESPANSPIEDIVPFVQPRRDSADQVGTVGYVTALCLNVRASGSSNAGVIGYVFKGERLAIRETRNNWSLVTNAAGDVGGWVSRDHLSAAPVTADFLMPADYGDRKTPTVIEGITASYVGVAVCKKCHSEPHAGFPQGPFGVWKNHFHSSALATLEKSYALAFAERRGVNNPRNDWRCVKCHVTAFGVPATRLAVTYRPEDGVGCEACHGPGGDYLKPHTDPNFDWEKLAAMGFRVFKDLGERDKLCRSCHNELSPTYKPFDVVSFSSVIRHWKKENNEPIAKFAQSVARRDAVDETMGTVVPPAPVTNSPMNAMEPQRPRLAGIANDWYLNTRGAKGRVFFPHLKHLDKILSAGAKQEVCQVCHHTTEAGDRPVNCSGSGCHLSAMTRVSNREEAFHGTCRACHRQQRRGPQKCSECHVR